MKFHCYVRITIAILIQYTLKTHSAPFDDLNLVKMKSRACLAGGKVEGRRDMRGLAEGLLDLWLFGAEKRGGNGLGKELRGRDSVP